jgi:hypothetical protein
VRLRKRTIVQIYVGRVNNFGGESGGKVSCLLVII